jgi:hypothetical protein
MSDNNISIPVNRKRFPALLIIGVVFTCIIVMILNMGGPVAPEYELTKRITDSIILLPPLFYTSTAFVEYMKTLFDKQAEMLISAKGIYDNLSVFSCGEVGWSEISGVELQKALNIEFLVIKLVNPAQVLARQSVLKRWVLNRYMRRYGSPIIISEKRVDYNLHELKGILSTHLT